MRCVSQLSTRDIEAGSRIRSARKSIGLTQEELAEEVNTSTTTISLWESGRCWPSRRELIVRLVEVLGCDPLWLLAMDNKQ